MKMKQKLIVSFMLVLLAPSIVIGAMGYFTAKSTVDETLINNASSNVDFINSFINKTVRTVYEDVNYFTGSINIDEEKETMNQFKQYQKLRPEVLAIYVGTGDGDITIYPENDLGENFDPRERTWYQEAASTKEGIITEPFVDAGTGEIIVSVAQQLQSGEGIVGVNISLTSLSEMVLAQSIGSNGYPFILSSENKYLVHPTETTGEQGEGKWIDEMMEKDSGVVDYSYSGEEKALIYTTNKITGWKIAGSVAMKDIASQSEPILTTTSVIIVLSIIVGAAVVWFIIRSINTPLQLLMSHAKQIQQGDLSNKVELKSKDEFGQLAVLFNDMIDTLRNLLIRVSEKSQTLAATSEEFEASTSQTSQSSEHIASSTQTFAQSTNDQTEQVQHMTEVVSNISNGVQSISTSSQEVASTALQATEVVEVGNQSIETTITQMNHINQKMTDLELNMNQLSKRSGEIGDIINVITSITEETNLLSLNASIEAARAGEAGKGFAVVAQEIRKLAEESSRSADQIRELVQNIQRDVQDATVSMNEGTQAVDEGIQVVQTANQSFEDITSFVSTVSSQIQQVSATSQELATRAVEVNGSIQEIKTHTESNVSQIESISAATEEQLASMEEVSATAKQLSDMAVELQSMVAHFKY
ncbi:methyl-accepting chemotaxis protein [Pontibacillus litoralis]|uniref:Chemotaxis protein n=1 Tax=Pontibacillus litoralis JSM 072002 TaxID=1385512 RepID=A0A0A5HNT6_9BACI|nr:methyl-accepting chemotaxis protein [Pontibacillus litoralis]KGX85302.1 hypothetical protein N784_09685 [Pontibacillus litoralis JSM 072002]